MAEDKPSKNKFQAVVDKTMHQKRTNRKKAYQPKRKQYTSLSSLVSEMTQEGVCIDVFDGLSIEANGYRYGMHASIVHMTPLIRCSEEVIVAKVKPKKKAKKALKKKDQ